MKQIYCIFFLFFVSTAQAGHKPGDSPPKVTTQQFTNWVFKCVEDHGKRNCELFQSLQIRNSNIRFTVSYVRFKNQKNENKEAISIIGPLGINLNTRLAIQFDKQGQKNLPWTKCEVMGCMVILTNNTANKELLALYSLIKKSFVSGQKAIIAVAGFQAQPLSIEMQLDGFNKALKKFNDEKL